MRNRLKCGILAGLMLVSGSLANFSHQTAKAEIHPFTRGVKVQVNDTLVEFSKDKPFIDDRHVLQVPVRVLAERLGLDIDWSKIGQTFEVKLKGKNDSFLFRTGEPTALHNGVEVKLKSPAVNKEGTVYVPLRFIAESLGLILQWDKRNRIAILGLDGKYHAPDWYAPKIEKTIEAVATAYSASAEENGPWGAVDYFGNPLKQGTIAVDPSVIPLGSTVYITGYKFDGLPPGGMIAKATDIGGAIKGNRIDIFIPASREKTRQFGIQKVKIYVLK